MRIALSIHSHTPQATEIHFFPAADLSSAPESDPLVMSWSNGVLDGSMTIPNLDSWRLVQSLDRLFQVDDKLTPLFVALAVMAAGGRQVVWDPASKRYHNLSTAADGVDTWEAVGIACKISVGAKDEDTAVKRLTNMVTDMMSEHPEQAADLSKFFSGGRKVQQVKSGKLPTAITIDSLANSAECADMAKARKEASK